MRGGWKLVLITLPLIAAGAGFLAYTVKSKPPPARTEQAQRLAAVRVVSVAEGRVAPRVRGYGLVAPSRSFQAIAQVGGLVDWVHPELEKGAVLPADTELIRIADAEYRLAVAQAEANIRAAEARLEELAVSRENQRAALEIETEALALKAAELERIEALFARGTVAQSARDTARAAHLAQRQKLQSVAGALALIPAQQAVQREQIALSRAALDSARLNLERTVLRLPFAARVASTGVEPGRFLRVGEVAATLDGVQRAEVEAQIPVAELRRLLRLSAPRAGAYGTDPSAITAVLRGLGLRAELRLDLGDEVLVWPARVDRVSDTIDASTGTLGVIVSVEAAYAGAGPATRPPLTKGMFVEVAIAGPPVSGIVIPRHALRAGRVLVVDAQDRLAERAVEAALIQDQIALVSAGLSPGERVLVSDPAVILPGMRLAPIEDRELAAALEAAR